MRASLAVWIAVLIAVLIVWGPQVTRLPAADKQEAIEPLPAEPLPPKSLPPEIVQTWRDAGANVGWMNANLYLNRPVFQAEGEADPPGRQWYEPSKAMPVFQFSEWEAGVLAKLPDPGAPFGLCLNLTLVTDAGLTELAGLKNLQALYLAGTEHGTETQITDAGLKELAGRKSLQTLDVRWTKVTDAGLKELAGLKSLQRLHLTGCQVTDAGLKQLAALESLQILNLGDTQVTSAGLKELVTLQSLQALYLVNTAVTDAGLKDLAALKSLQFLNLVGCSGVTDAGLNDLGTLKSLKDLQIRLTKVTAAGAAALRKDLPACNVH